jgi:hypothetical protein
MITSTQELKLAPRRGASAVFLLATLAAASAQAAVNSGSTGADGAFSPTVNTEVVLPESGILNYTTVNIPTGVTVKFKKNTANTPVFILATGNVTIAGKIDITGADGKATGTYGDGVLGDDAQPGVGGPGGYDGGRGGRDDLAQRPDIVRGGSGLGPGGGKGGVEGGDGSSCADGIGYSRYMGAGGGYAESAIRAYSHHCVNPPTPLYIAGKAYGSALLQPLLGGSGGGGGRGGRAFSGSGGGGGGGGLLIATSGALSITGSVDATGGDGGGAAGTEVGGHGAGGSGGAIRLVATTISGNGSVLANGGCLNHNNQRRQNCGWGGIGGQYGGSPGRIRFEADAVTFTGSSLPTYSVDTPGPIFISGAPSIRIASVAGQNVPANPTGNADVTLPATTTSAIDVVFQTVNVPVGNTVLLRVVPAYGQPIEVLSPAIAGTTAAGTANVSVTLPQGPSTLQATTTYTVVVGGTNVAGSPDLSRFARNEAVDKVEITVPLVGEATARLHTVSGKTYDVSYAALRAAGFRG